MREDELLRLAMARGMIDLDAIKDQIEIMERNRYLDQHTYKVWQDSSGRWATYIKDGDSRKLIKKRKKEDLEDALIDYYSGINKGHCIFNLCMEWLQKKLEYGEIEPQTCTTYVNCAIRFFNNSELENKDISDIDDYQLEDFIKKTIKEKHITTNSLIVLKYLIRGAYTTARKKGYIQENINLFLDGLEISPKTLTRYEKTDAEQVFTDEEVEKICNYIYNCKPTQVHIGIIFAIQTGLRIGELATLKRTDLEGHCLNVARTEVRLKEGVRVQEKTKGKAGKRVVFVTDNAIKTFNQLVSMNPDGEYIFERKNGKRLIASNFTTSLYRICDKLEIPRRSMHKCRKTYATRMINNGLNDKLVQKQMGHTSIDTTRRYYYFNNNSDDESVALVEKAMGIY